MRGHTSKVRTNFRLSSDLQSAGVIDHQVPQPPNVGQGLEKSRWRGVRGRGVGRGMREGREGECHIVKLL